jgi:hypothetical protein
VFSVFHERKIRKIAHRKHGINGKKVLKKIFEKIQ